MGGVWRRGCKGELVGDYVRERWEEFGGDDVRERWKEIM